MSTPDQQEQTASSKPIVAQVALLGADKVGKSSLATRLGKNTFSGKHDTSSKALFVKKEIADVVIDKDQSKTTVSVEMWDVPPGQLNFRSLMQAYCKKANFFIFVASHTDEASLTKIPGYAKNVVDAVSKNRDSSVHAIFVLTNKDAAEQKVSVEDASNLMNELKTNHGIDFAAEKPISISNKDDDGDALVQALFPVIAKEVANRPPPPPPPAPPVVVVEGGGEGEGEGESEDDEEENKKEEEEEAAETQN